MWQYINSDTYFWASGVFSFPGCGRQTRYLVERPPGQSRWLDGSPLQVGDSPFGRWPDHDHWHTLLRCDCFFNVLVNQIRDEIASIIINVIENVSLRNLLKKPRLHNKKSMIRSEWACKQLVNYSVVIFILFEYCIYQLRFKNFLLH